VTRAGFAYLGTLVAALTAFGMTAEDKEAGSVPTDATRGTSTDLVVDTPSVPPSAEIVPEGTSVVEVPRDEPGDDDGRRRRWRNRYPGPIPTPAEWRPPEGPVRIGLQAGHWRAHEAPDELRGIRDNGTRWRDMLEWEANLQIAERAGEMLRELGYEVDVLPAVVPPGYRAHLFISIHADGAGDPAASGYRVAAPRRDATGRAERIARLLQDRYGEETGLRQLPTVTRRMSNYYAFNYRRYEHALHPMTVAVILETGFLTSARDRTVIVDDPDRAARGIVAAVTGFDVTPPPLATTVTDGAAGGGTR
jgi:N-acetylmuramoyl-L-alanine amidase